MSRVAVGCRSRVSRVCAVPPVCGLGGTARVARPRRLRAVPRLRSSRPVRVRSRSTEGISRLCMCGGVVSSCLGSAVRASRIGLSRATHAERRLRRDCIPPRWQPTACDSVTPTPRPSNENEHDQAQLCSGTPRPTSNATTSVHVGPRTGIDEPCVGAYMQWPEVWRLQ